jgi:hypothetical protein
MLNLLYVVLRLGRPPPFTPFARGVSAMFPAFAPEYGMRPSATDYGTLTTGASGDETSYSTVAEGFFALTRAANTRAL